MTSTIRVPDTITKLDPQDSYPVVNGEDVKGFNDLKTKAESNEQEVQKLTSDMANKIEGISVTDNNGVNVSGIKGLAINGADVVDDGDDTVTITMSSEVTVSNGQGPSSVSYNGNTLVFEGATLTQDSQNAKTLIIGRTDTPTFDPSMFQSAVDHGYAADDQGIKQDTTTDGWWIFKDLKSVGGRPADSQGELIVFKNTIAHNNPALKHVFLMALGYDKSLNSEVWFSYRDGTKWTPWFNVEGEDQVKLDQIVASVNDLKKAQEQALNEIQGLQTAAGNLYAPDKATFDKAVNALIAAALKNYTPSRPGHGGDKPTTVFPRFYAQFSNGVPADFTDAVTSTNAEATLLRIPTSLMRIFISVENDNDEASKVKGFKFNNRQEMSLQHRDITIQGKKYRAFFTAGGFTEKKVDIKIDFGQGI